MPPGKGWQCCRPFNSHYILGCEPKYELQPFRPSPGVRANALPPVETEAVVCTYEDVAHMTLLPLRVKARSRKHPSAPPFTTRAFRLLSEPRKESAAPPSALWSRFVPDAICRVCEHRGDHRRGAGTV
jgi:hypothetical protein